MEDKRIRLASCLLGQAFGDSMGLPYEGLRPAKAAKRWERFGAKQSFAFGRGVVSDDTDHAALAIQSLWLCGECPRKFQKLLRARIRGWVACLPSGVGMATLKAGAKMWLFLPNTAVGSAGNGAAMRSVAVGAFFPGDEALAARFAKASCLLTHADSRAVASSQSLAALASQCAGAVHDGGVSIKALRKALLGSHVDACPAWEAEALALLDALEDPSKAQMWRKRLDAKGKGIDGYCLRSAPWAIYLWAKSDAMDSIAREAALAGGDVDTHAAMACALAGASWARASLPMKALGGLGDWPLSVSRLEAIARGEAWALRSGDLLAGWMLRSLPMMAAVLAHGFRRALPY